MLTGYFEISTGGVQNTRKSYWSNDANSSTQQSPNAISIGRSEKADFEKASEIINKIINKASDNASGVDFQQIEKLADLHKKGIITQQEFEAKKRQILGL